MYCWLVTTYNNAIYAHNIYSSCAPGRASTLAPSFIVSRYSTVLVVGLVCISVLILILKKLDRKKKPQEKYLPYLLSAFMPIIHLCSPMYLTSYPKSQLQYSIYFFFVFSQAFICFFSGCEEWTINRSFLSKKFVFLRRNWEWSWNWEGKKREREVYYRALFYLLAVRSLTYLVILYICEHW